MLASVSAVALLLTGGTPFTAISAASTNNSVDPYPLEVSSRITERHSSGISARKRQVLVKEQTVGEKRVFKCDRERATLVGSRSDDVITGTPGTDVIVAREWQ